MSAHYHVSVDIARSLVRIWLGGFFTPADIAAFLAERNAAHAQLICAPNQHLTLTDVRDMKIQPQETVAAFRELLADRRHHSRKVAFVAAPSLAQMQLSRAADKRAARVFTDPAAAEAWLFERDIAAPPARATVA
jgi:hypothetical protein